MNREEIISELGDAWSGVRECMDKALHSDIGLLNSVNGSVLGHGGKQLRPMMSLLSAKACGEISRDSVLYAAAAELLHNATLMHDDVADESRIRRGTPTLSAQIGPSSAVLVGDFWLARAVEMVLNAKTSDKVVSLFSKTLTDLAEGEMLQLEKALSADTVEEDYYRIIYCKTASLFESAVVSGAVSVGAPEAYRKAVGSYARAAGVAFQIKDDILDYAGSSELGKPVGIDLKEKKITLPLLGALRDSPREAEVRAMVRDMDSHPENAAAVREFVIDNGGVEYAISCLDAYILEAEKALSALPPSAARQHLVEIARYNAFRNA